MSLGETALREDLRRRFVPRETGSPVGLRPAFVAAILRGDSLGDLEVGFIRRALQDGDRWAGQIAFPGGRAEPEDADHVASALRETREEIGLDLPRETLVGALDDIRARKGGQLLDFCIRPYVFYYNKTFEPVMDPREVADFFWISIADLRHEGRQIQYELMRQNMTMQLPAIQMPSDPPLWGLTYMMTQELLAKLA